jgi:aquaporin NIP
LLAEFIGTFAIVLFGCGSIIISNAGHLHPLGIPLIFGLVVTAMIYTLGHVSGAHFNPAVTVAFAVSRHFPFKETLAYASSQILGGICAIAVLTCILPINGVYGATQPNVLQLQALVWEILLSFFLMLVIMAVATDTRAVGIMAGAAIGATVMLDAFVGGWATGASMNPARSIAPALWQATLPTLWIYLLGPLAGTILGALAYKAVGKQ